MTDTLTRSAPLGEVTGRTLEGVAYRYQYPSRVSDDGRTHYYEEFTTGTDTRTRSHRTEWPVYRAHGWKRGEEALGSVSFHTSEDEGALMFRAIIDESAEGDALLADVDEDWRDVSVAFDPVHNAVRKTRTMGSVVQRVEIRLKELSIAENGSGLHKGAGITLVRAQDGLVPFKKRGLIRV